MIQKPTVLILGAGSSNHLRYPLGLQLLNQVCHRIKEDDYDKTLPYKPDQIEIFHRRLSRAGYYSVDAFLEENREFLDIGKYFTAYCLKQCEIEDKLFPPHNPGWYQYLFNKLLTFTADKIPDNKITIITFNYDRSLECYLHQMITNRFQIPEEKSVEIIRQLNIIHPHGILGNYPKVPYSNELNGISFDDISKGIKIIHEIEDSEEDFCSTEFRDSNRALCESEKIYFLGFGFHEDNIRRFNFFSNDSLKDREVDATTYNLEPAERKELISRMSKYGFSEKNFRPSGDCMGFFQNIGVLE